MSETVAFIPGSFPEFPGPLGRYLPPLPEGVGRAWLSGRVPSGAWVIDPFSASPRLDLEIARAGYRVLVAANNPIARFLLEIYANPPDEMDLRSALADLAVEPRTGERLEQQIRALYNTECAQCSRPIEAQAFVWDKDGGLLVGRIYNCPFCKDSGERPPTAADMERAVQAGGRGLHRARALERVAPLNDPDRAYAEEALSVYSARAVNVLFRLVNRLERMAGQRRWLASALLLAAFDQANSLWHSPPIRFRPKQLSLPPRYLEKNIWLALEEAVTGFAAALKEAARGGGSVPTSVWPELPQQAGSLCIFEGRLKDLAAQLETRLNGDVRIAAMLGALPRPNQAFWTLSDLWAGWLWGQAASASFKSVLRRRRYDWGWHTDALTSVFSSLAPLLETGTPCLGLIGEAEPGFLSAALLAGELGGLSLEGMALRLGSEQAQIHWKKLPKTDLPALTNEPDVSSIEQSILEYLRQRGEPAGYLKIHAAALSAIVRSRSGRGETGLPPADLLRQTELAIEQALSRGRLFVRFGVASRNVETGQWWLAEPALADEKVLSPLADRVEMSVVRRLQSSPGSTLFEIDLAVCSELAGLQTPELELVEVCLNSYGIQAPLAGGAWRLRPEDEPAARRADISQITQLIEALGLRLGFQVPSVPERARSSARPPVVWLAPPGEPSYSFHITASGVLGKIVHQGEQLEPPPPAPHQPVIVLPGGRAALVELKMRRDPRLRKTIEDGWLFVKFRHVRWLAENESLSRLSLDESLGLDPLANRDPQMLLL